MNLFARLLSGTSLVTILRYALQAVGGILVAEGEFEWDQWQTLSGAVLTIVPLVLGVKASITPKVVTDDASTVPLKKLPSSTATVANEQAKTVAKSRPNLLDRLRSLFGQ